VALTPQHVCMYVCTVASQKPSTVGRLASLFVVCGVVEAKRRDTATTSKTLSDKQGNHDELCLAYTDYSLSGDFARSCGIVGCKAPREPA
jgi:hypothetical protein